MNTAWRVGERKRSRVEVPIEELGNRVFVHRMCFGRIEIIRDEIVGQ
jgi:hypothetical protein